VGLDSSSSVARIDRVLPGFGADKAGLKPGDVVVEVEGMAVESGEALIEALREYREGQTVKLRIERDRDGFEVEVELRAESASPFLRGFDRQSRMDRMGGSVSRRAEGFEQAIQHDTVLPPWLCGGPLVNLEGKAVGVNIARAGRVASYALPAELLQTIVRGLREKAERRAE
jgi:serine protease Do